MTLNDKQMKFQSTKAVKAYLRSRGIPESTVRGISAALIDDAIRQSDSLLIARFFTAFALALREEGWGAERITRMLQRTDKQMGRVTSGDCTWRDLINELREQTGLIVNCDPEWSETELPDEYKEVH
jgi:hypothetical protein